MQAPCKYKEYWRKNLRVTAILLAIWFSATFVIGYFARALSEFTIFGFPFPFYMAAQGSLVVYILIVWYYVHRMSQLDREYGEGASGTDPSAPPDSEPNGPR